jgi:hypothetical protein
MGHAGQANGINLLIPFCLAKLISAPGIAPMSGYRG